MTAQLKGTWNAAAFFEKLTATNRLALAEGFTFCRVSGLEGFEEAVAQMQNTAAFVCVSDVADGYTDLNNTPRTRRIKTVFFAMRHAAEDMEARAECMATMRELFRQFATRLILEKSPFGAELHLPRPPNIVQRDRPLFFLGSCRRILYNSGRLFYRSTLL